MIFKVKKGGSILGPNNVLYRSGQVVPSGLLSAAQIKEHLSSGYLTALRSKPPELSPEEVEAGLSAEEESTDAPPGVETNLGISEEGTPTITSLWAIDPDGLRSMSLDQLNVMIMERDDKVEPFEDLEEAIAWLSQDYEEPA